MSIGALVGYGYGELITQVHHLPLEPFFFAAVGAAVFMGVLMKLLLTAVVLALLVIASMILFFKKPSVERSTKKNRAILLFAGSIGGVFSGFLGIGGGSIISPILLLFGYDAKKIAIGISFVIPFSSIVAFVSYANHIELDYMLLVVVGVAAYIGGMIGNYILHFKVSSQTIKKILALALYSIAIKMLLG